MEDKKDIFDRIMGCRAFGCVWPFYTAHKEVLLYLFFGGLTTFISILSFAVFYDMLCVNEHIANVLSWLLAVAFAFWTNRTWVFQGAKGSFFQQMVSFYGGRVLTLLAEEIILFVFVSCLSFVAVWIKVIAQVVVLVLNYLVSKFLVFRKPIEEKIDASF